MTYRVIQWATGNVGRTALRAVAKHPELELVGLLVHDPAKQGLDAGELCKLGPLGVKATCDADEVLALDADCVLHMPLPSARGGEDPGRDLRDLCRILASGKNAVTTVGYVHPKIYGSSVTDPLEKACAEGRSSLHGTGVNPGWLAEVVPLTASALSARIDRIHVLESTDFSFYPSADVIFGLMGLGSAPEEFEGQVASYRRWLSGLFRESLELVAEGLALELDGVEEDFEVARAHESFDIAAGRIEQGSIAAQRFEWRGMAGGEARIVFEAVYRARADVSPEWPAPGCAVRIDGRPRMRFELGEGWISNALVATAMHAVHAVAPVCQAAPGIRTFLDLPLIMGRHSIGA